MLNIYMEKSNMIYRMKYYEHDMEFNRVNNIIDADIILFEYINDAKKFFDHYDRTKYKKPICVIVATHETRIPGYNFPMKTISHNNHIIFILSGRNNMIYDDIFNYFRTRDVRYDIELLKKKFLNKKIVIFQTYFNVNYMTKLRESIAIELHKRNKIDIFGKNWPSKISLGEQRKTYIESKKILSEPYAFCLCFENDIWQNYVTEKIYDSIENLMLPIYMGTEWIYDWFPKNSFLDWKEIRTVDNLMKIINEMTIEEYLHRMKLLIDFMILMNKMEVGKGAIRRLFDRILITYYSNCN